MGRQQHSIHVKIIEILTPKKEAYGILKVQNVNTRMIYINTRMNRLMTATTCDGSGSYVKDLKIKVTPFYRSRKTNDTTENNFFTPEFQRYIMPISHLVLHPEDPGSTI